MKHIFIVNPAAGKSDRTAEYREMIDAAFAPRGLRYELLVSNAPGECRTLARQAVAAIFEFLPRACADGNDLQARQELLTASYRAGFAFTRASVGNVHAIAHTLGGLYDVPHGRANAVLLPVVLEEYGAAAHKRLAELADVVGLCPAGSTAEKARAFIAAIYAMNRQLGISADFACIRTEDLPQMAAWAEAEANPVYPVPVVFDRQRFIKVIRRVMVP